MLINELQNSKDFLNEINNTINQFQQRIPIIFTQTLNLIRMTIQENALISMFSSNWNIIRDEEDIESNNTYITIPVIHNDTTENISCSCATLRACSMPVGYLKDKKSSMVYFDGILFVCNLLETVLLSSLSCFYSLTCIANIRDSMDASDIYYDNSTQLNDSLTRFNISDTNKKLANEIFIESWIINVSYESFYNSCSPTYCTYTYYYRFDTVELLTTFLSVFAGLSTVIRFIVPYLMKIFQNLQRHIHVTPLINH
ncbi:unnamed protein product [Adineta ricciae]|uniref:Uncharacterized protein n=1 Tax=Adineta ricciae TaxID=249248 RepID=A0A815EGL3_ADIRI|nr:unnamed protein product [Adineta ricciae]CAF1649155.1 unnamed protein product [Adineta ricciae]